MTNILNNHCCMFCAVLISFCVITYALVLAKYVRTETYLPESTIPGPRATGSLKFIIVISRHGNRRLNFTFPNDPYPLNDVTYWPHGVGELTTHGRVQMYNLGKKIRRLYDGFLGRDYDTHEIQASSTAMNRAIMSGEVFLSALYPPSGIHLWNKQLPWQPIPIYSDSLDKSVGVADCQRYMQEREKCINKFKEDYASQINNINRYTSQYAGEIISGSLGLFAAWDTFIAEDTEGYALPEWMRGVYPQPIEELIGIMNIAVHAPNNLIFRLTMGPFYKKIMGVIKSKIAGKLSPNKKMYYYSGHDSSLLCLQGILGIPQSHFINVVKPASAMIFEVHQDPGSSIYTVQVLYIDGSSPTLEPTTFNIPNCPSPCDFTKLANITSHFTNVTDYAEECKPISSTS